LEKLGKKWLEFGNDWQKSLEAAVMAGLVPAIHVGGRCDIIRFAGH
jgi:hypothetical protein